MSVVTISKQSVGLSHVMAQCLNIIMSGKSPVETEIIRSLKLLQFPVNVLFDGTSWASIGRE